MLFHFTPCRFHCHYDEAFSSLQVPHFKGFLRFHVTRGGDLEMFGLALERVPHAWREDPRWRTPHGGGNRDAPAHRATFPSRCAGGPLLLPVCPALGHRAWTRLPALPSLPTLTPRSWVPVEEKPHLLRPPRMEPPPEAQLKMVDYLYVPRRRAGRDSGSRPSDT